MISLGAADALWAGLTVESAVPAASGVFTRAPATPRLGYLPLGATVVRLEANDGRGAVYEVEVRRAAAELNAIRVDRRDLVRIGPFGDVPKNEYDGPTLRHWRKRITWELQNLSSHQQTAREGGGRLAPLAGIDWAHVLVEQHRGSSGRSWWLPRAVVRLLDAAAHAETRWLQATRSRQKTTPVIEPAVAHTATTHRSLTAGSEDPTAPLRSYKGELHGHVYSVLMRKPGMSRRVAGWACAVCRTAASAVVDHCHEHGYVRAPVCQSCNTLERPDHLYSNDVRVAGRYQRLFDTEAADWLRHWHRCPGCRARTTLPLPHLAAWTAHIACRSLRPAHRGPRGCARKPCGVLRVSWTGNQKAPRSCLLTVFVDCCPSGEHRVLARVSYREAAQRFGTWLTETAPAVAAAAGPDRTDDLPARVRPVIADTSGEDQALF